MKNSSPGFTLLEVMMAVGIIAIALTAVLGLQSQSISLATEARFNTTAALLAQHKMAEMELEVLHNIVSDSGGFGDDFPDYRWDLNVRRVTLPGKQAIAGHLRQIDLDVSWGEDKLYKYRLRLYRFFP
ncbi:MAG: prepilin-type N-terminal cleavage/methylation domain-containing protein [Thermodesulfobacteriota bacterium]|nr:prepilin-type N-terminal cleavage/methylation domain-containing protein [Thermodesulfobacteriota bacterium]